jgi:urease accessory protein
MLIQPPNLRPATANAIPAYVRAQGRIDLRFSHGEGGTHVIEWTETGGFRARFPKTFDESCEAVLINTGGGMTGGDSLVQSISLDPGSHVLVTTQAAEKIYRSSGDLTQIDTRLTLAADSQLAFIPQETILFSGAMLKRTLETSMSTDSQLTVCESVYFGRGATGEILEQGLFRDRWRIRRDGKLIFADDVRLEGLLGVELQRKAVANGARAIATILHSATGLDQLESLRELSQVSHDRGVEVAAGIINGMMVVRLLAMEAQLLRRELTMLLEHLLARTLPRTWST